MLSSRSIITTKPKYISFTLFLSGSIQKIIGVTAANIRLTADVNLFFRYLVVTNISYTAITEKAVIAT